MPWHRVATPYWCAWTSSLCCRLLFPTTLLLLRHCLDLKLGPPRISCLASESMAINHERNFHIVTVGVLYFPLSHWVIQLSSMESLVSWLELNKFEQIMTIIQFGKRLQFQNKHYLLKKTKFQKQTLAYPWQQESIQRHRCDIGSSGILWAYVLLKILYILFSEAIIRLHILSYGWMVLLKSFQCWKDIPNFSGWSV